MNFWLDTGDSLRQFQLKRCWNGVLERPNLQRALKQVRRNKGVPSIDGMSVDELTRHLKEHWL